MQTTSKSRVSSGISCIKCQAPPSTTHHKCHGTWANLTNSTIVSKCFHQTVLLTSRTRLETKCNLTSVESVQWKECTIKSWNQSRKKGCSQILRSTNRVLTAQVFCRLCNHPQILEQVTQCSREGSKQDSLLMILKSNQLKSLTLAWSLTKWKLRNGINTFRMMQIKLLIILIDLRQRQTLGDHLVLF